MRRPRLHHHAKITLHLLLTTAKERPIGQAFCLRRQASAFIGEIHWRGTRGQRVAETLAALMLDFNDAAADPAGWEVIDSPGTQLLSGGTTTLSFSGSWQDFGRA